MKKILITLLFVYSIVQAQVPSVGLNIQSVYTGIKMPLLFNPGCENKNNLKFDVENGEIVKDSSGYFLIANANGLVVVKIKYGEKIVASYNFKSKPMPDLNITIGNITYNKIPASLFSLQTGLKCVLPDFLHEDDYKVISASVYFSGTNFKDIVLTNITNSFSPIQSYINRCDVGSVITIDNVKVQGPAGVMMANGLSVMLY